MVGAVQNLSVSQQQKRQRQERLVWTAGLDPVCPGLRRVAGAGNRAAASGGWTGCADTGRWRSLSGHAPGSTCSCSARCSLNSGVSWGSILLTARLPFYQTFSGTGGHSAAGQPPRSVPDCDPRCSGLAAHGSPWRRSSCAVRCSRRCCSFWLLWCCRSHMGPHAEPGSGHSI